ncbi:putative pumilio-like 7, chloroplastic [Heracleum sosnowskyi]|uniref:Pumilio-like 7, chloroplastic n=1 Tax=Heracleum sosnowskyi TaxID=360622 RepID=A0AAD8IUZ1_9APIA|nr:putative pumilio-like 7, chloroplastic [Heracleum sosnowskyi]
MNVGNIEGGEQNLGMFYHQNFHQNGFNGLNGSGSSGLPGNVSSCSGGFFVSGSSSSSEAPFGFLSPFGNSPNGVVLDNDFGLSDNLARMHIGVDGLKGYGFDSKISGFSPDGFGLSNQHLYKNGPCNVGGSAYNVGNFQSLVGGGGGFQGSCEQNKGVFFEVPQGYNVGGQGQFPVFSCQASSDSGARGYGLELRNEQGRGFSNGGIHLQDALVNRSCCNDSLYNLEERRFLKSQDLYQFENGRVVLGADNPMYIRRQEVGGVPSFTSNPVVLSMPNVGGLGVCDGGIQLQNPSLNNPYCNDPSYYLQEGSFLRSQDPYRVEDPKLVFGVENPAYVMERSTRGVTSCKVNPLVLSMPNAGGVGGFGYDSSLMLQGNGVNFVADKQCDHLRGLKKSSLNGNSFRNQQEKRKELSNQNHSGGASDEDSSLLSNPSPIVPSYGSLQELKGGIYYMAKDQLGCRFLQKQIEEGSPQDVQLIFLEIIDHVVELMINPFGNYLIQKLTDVCTEDQKMQIVRMVTDDPWVLVTICSDTHGTCSIQKLIKSLKTKQQITSLTMALEPGFLDLIKDVNGNHVLQCCLKCLGHNYNKCLFIAATKYCVEIATHRHGCCVLNQCIAHSTGKFREKLIAEVCFNALLLAQDSFGNYVVQYVVELKIPAAAATLLSRLEGNFVYLSMQKFGSHVVEKCLKFSEESRPKIITEFLSVPYFNQLLQDPFANYVIQSALEVSKGALRAALVQAIGAHSLLRTSPYCKKIFSRNLLKN